MENYYIKNSTRETKKYHQITRAEKIYLKSNHWKSNNQSLKMYKTSVRICHWRIV